MGEYKAHYCLDRIVVTHHAGLIIIFQLLYYNSVLMYTLHNLHVYAFISARKPTDRKSGYSAYYVIAVYKNIVTSYASCKLSCVRNANNYNIL